ncbi:MAG TPA: MlaD family protein [Vicinamibacteria bacterium]|nr:MlaD family protein [Vicinamibacteria bacterium]
MIEPVPDPKTPPPAAAGTAGASPRLVGAFVLVALAIALAGLAALSSGSFFTANRVYVIFFPNAVGGLKDGAPVTFRQVPVGRVRDVDLVFTGANIQETRIMTVIEIPRGRIRNVAGSALTVQMSDAEMARVLIEGGVRAAVRSTSPIAGQRSVDLDFHPEIAPRFARFASRYPELPTAPTGFELLNERIEATLQKVSDVPVDEVLMQLQTTLASVQKLLDAGHVEAALGSLRVTLDTANKALARSDRTLGTVDAMANDMRATLAGVDNTMRSVQGTLVQLERTLATVDRNVERSAEVQHDAALALEETNELLKSLRILADTIQQHPEALVRGKPEPERK